MTWPQVGEAIATSAGVFLPVGSTEQHGPMGLIGTDAFCATLIAEGAARAVGALVAPTLALTPAPFNTAFPGTLSISEGVFAALAGEVIDGLAAQGFARVYVLNAHGANLAPLRGVLAARASVRARLKSWWDFEAVNVLRREWYGDWEGMHATPSEVAITMTFADLPVVEAAREPPEPLSATFVKAHAGDRHGPPEEHRRDFPDGRVGSHSALATRDQGRALLAVAVQAVAADYRDWS